MTGKRYRYYLSRSYANMRLRSIKEEVTPGVWEFINRRDREHFNIGEVLFMDFLLEELGPEVSRDKRLAMSQTREFSTWLRKVGADNDW